MKITTQRVRDSTVLYPTDAELDLIRAALSLLADSGNGEQNEAAAKYLKIMKEV